MSLEGRIDLKDVKFYCGEGTLNVTSVGNKLNVILWSVTKQVGSLFCTVKVIQNESPVKKCICGQRNSVSVANLIFIITQI